MMKLIQIPIPILLSFALVGCKQGKAADKGSGGGAYPPAFAAWDMAARKAAWQGAWAGEGGMLGSKAAWQIAGDKITYVDQKGEKQLTLELESPCSAKFVEKTASGSSSTTTSFTLKDGQLVTGLGAAGQRKGAKAVVCGGGDIYTLDGAACLVWGGMFDKLESKPGTCGFRQEGGKEVFFYESHGRESVVDVDGDVIWSEQLRDVHAAKHPDLAAARAAQGL